MEASPIPPPISEGASPEGAPESEEELLCTPSPEGISGGVLSVLPEVELTELSPLGIAGGVLLVSPDADDEVLSVVLSEVLSEVLVVVSSVLSESEELLDVSLLVLSDVVSVESELDEVLSVPSVLEELLSPG
jgi:hypothetical protein